MNEAELKAIDKRLADMSARVDAVIEKESRGKRMPVLDFKPRKLSGGLTSQPAARSRAKGNYEPVDHEISDEALRSATIKFDHAMDQAPDGSIEQIFAEFERQFDEMAQAHRQRG